MFSFLPAELIPVAIVWINDNVKRVRLVEQIVKLWPTIKTRKMETEQNLFPDINEKLVIYTL